MAFFLVRAGKYGEHEERFFSENRIYLTWDGMMDVDLSSAADHDAIKALVAMRYPQDTPRKIGNFSGQIWAFALAIKPGDWIALPKKQKGTIAIGEVRSAYKYLPDGDGLYRHYREVKWLNTDIPRSRFDQDLLYSLGAFMTVCKIERNDAEARIRSLVHKLNSSSSEALAVEEPSSPNTAQDSSSEAIDIEQFTRDLISKHIIRKFKGHGLARLVDAVLRAQGFTTYLSPEGPDRGVDSPS